MSLSTAADRAKAVGTITDADVMNIAAMMAVAAVATKAAMTTAEVATVTAVEVMMSCFVKATVDGMVAQK